MAAHPAAIRCALMILDSLGRARAASAANGTRKQWESNRQTPCVRRRKSREGRAICGLGNHVDLRGLPWGAEGIDPRPPRASRRPRAVTAPLFQGLPRVRLSI